MDEIGKAASAYYESAVPRESFYINGSDIRAAFEAGANWALKQKVSPLTEKEKQPFLERKSECPHDRASLFTIRDRMRGACIWCEKCDTHFYPKKGDVE